MYGPGGEIGPFFLFLFPCPPCPNASLFRVPVMTSISDDLSGFLYDPDKSTKVHTKIVCTIGPASWTYDGLMSLLKAGMSVARLNFSHGTHEGHQKVIDTFRQVCKDADRHCALMLDTKGPEIRTMGLKENPSMESARKWQLEKGTVFTFHTDPALEGDNTQVSVTYANFAKVLKVGSIVLLDDGLVGFCVDKIEGTTVTTTVLNTGFIGTHKGVNLPGAKIDLPAVTEKDKADIAFGVKNNVDFIAASFIRSAANVQEIRALPGVVEKNIRIISKIESAEGVENFLQILEVTDGIMVARGDLAVEIPLEKVPAAQKMMIRHCNMMGKPVITATQMMDSMTNNPRPTRAEVTDVANAVFDGTDCVMLSGESANGKYPTETVETMLKICREAEKSLNYRSLYKYARENAVQGTSFAESVCSSTVKTAWDIDAKLILGLTESGKTAHLISKYRPSCPVLCVTTSDQVARQCLVHRSLYPVVILKQEDNSLKIDHALEFAKKDGFVVAGDTCVTTSGVISGNMGGTNIMSIDTVE